MERGWYSAAVMALLLCLFIVFSPPALAQEDELARGRSLLRTNACLACHSLDGTAHVGPTLLDIVGRETTIVSGAGTKSLVADESYLRRALQFPDAEVVEGYMEGTMPAYALAEEDLGAIMAVMRDLSSKDGVEAQYSMSALVGLGICSFLFVVVHLFLSSIPIRTPLIYRMGSFGFQTFYGLLVIVLMLAQIAFWTQSPFVDVWDPPVWTRYIPLVTMPFAFLLIVVGYTISNPTVAGMESRLRSKDLVKGMIRLTRHPANMSYVVWGGAHLSTNGDLASFLLFGSLVLLAILGSVHIDLRRKKTSPDDWQHFAASTSLVPFWAIIRGRAALSPRTILCEIGWWRLLLALGCYAMWLFIHVYAVGSSPMPLGWQLW
jgi:uncharacterized membrane protein/cytochrome c2